MNFKLSINKPVLLFDESKIHQNLDRMIEKARINSVNFRPHFKTHQSRYIANLCRKKGVESITVSSVSMAKYFCEDGWTDITIAVPFNILELEDLKLISSKCKLNICIENKEVLDALIEEDLSELGVFIELDAGYGRSGISCDSNNQILSLVAGLKKSKSFKFKGILCHYGNTYNETGIEGITDVFETSMKRVRSVYDVLKGDYPDMEVSIGDTPSCTLFEEFDCATEIRPGNFITYDVMQYSKGVCPVDAIAVALVCPVISTYPEKEEVLIYGGGSHLSKEGISFNGKQIYGLLGRLSKDGWKILPDNNYVYSLSQVHGKIKLSRNEFEKTKPGDVLLVLPVHSCMTINEMKSMHSLNGETADVMPY